LTKEEKTMASSLKPIPDGYHTVNAYLTVQDGPAAIDFYQKAFGMEVGFRLDSPPGKVGHAELRLGDSVIMLSDEMPGGACRSPQSLGGTTVTLFLYVPDVDRAFHQAVAAGAKVVMPPEDMFWGDRFGSVTDPFGHNWGLATHIEDLSPEELQKRAAAAMAQMGLE
jgi:PhnB protein